MKQAMSKLEQAFEEYEKLQSNADEAFEFVNQCKADLEEAERLAELAKLKADEAVKSSKEATKSESPDMLLKADEAKKANEAFKECDKALKKAKKNYDESVNLKTEASKLFWSYQKEFIQIIQEHGRINDNLTNWMALVDLNLTELFLFLDITSIYLPAFKQAKNDPIAGKTILGRFFEIVVLCFNTSKAIVKSANVDQIPNISIVFETLVKKALEIDLDTKFTIHPEKVLVNMALKEIVLPFPFENRLYKLLDLPEPGTVQTFPSGQTSNVSPRRPKINLGRTLVASTRKQSPEAKKAVKTQGNGKIKGVKGAGK